ncbi:hypothetical protein [Streptomyces sp. NPDC058701]
MPGPGTPTAAPAAPGTRPGFAAHRTRTAPGGSAAHRTAEETYQ